ncbi:MAG: type II secretion system protein [Planctomycetes bacterium]|nr:type II secretion system protein [Planctomycetota bacterium]MBI3835727.1 type II secretion system protein [Planctomycetota bacterium]
MIMNRRGVFLVEMLTVIVIVGIGGTLMAVGLASMLRSQKRVAEFGNQYAEINDFLRCFSRDVRQSTSVVTHETAGETVRQVVALNLPSGQLVYRFFEQKVEREARPGIAPKSWTPLIAHAEIVSGKSTSNGTGVSIAVSWRRLGAKDPEPSRRIDRIVRCAGEIGHEDE